MPEQLPSRPWLEQSVLGGLSVHGCQNPGSVFFVQGLTLGGEVGRGTFHEVQARPQLPQLLRLRLARTPPSFHPIADRAPSEPGGSPSYCPVPSLCGTGGLGALPSGVPYPTHGPIARPGLPSPSGAGSGFFLTSPGAPTPAGARRPQSAAAPPERPPAGRPQP
ncbi:hypothetical protein P7K49_035538 [Saguinus oedipus]|uniref:Uncharacterized protein n=1 Tax=Saguinus oedipus TaxID=9490 RepID=A0ABQ9TN03_SAGOE|nr:hypothetical protein P7K49_035538 [Saguinus oedipus]